MENAQYKLLKYYYCYYYVRKIGKNRFFCHLCNSDPGIDLCLYKSTKHELIVAWPKGMDLQICLHSLIS